MAWHNRLRNRLQTEWLECCGVCLSIPSAHSHNRRYRRAQNQKTTDLRLIKALGVHSVYSFLDKCAIDLYIVQVQDYSGFQKNVPLFERFFLQPLIPAFRILELIFEKRHKLQKEELWN